MMKSYLRAACGISTLAFVAISAVAHAQGLPDGTAGQQAPASKGATDLTTQSFETAAPKQDDAAAKDATELSVGAGGLASSGNARLLSATAGSQFRLRRDDNQLTAAVAGNYSRTAVAGVPLETTVANLQGRTRYDRFFGDWTLFLGVQARNDRFQGLDLRLQIDPGVAYYFVNDPKQQLWAELGYDYLHDIRRNEDLVVLDATGAPTGVILPKTNSVHSGRLFLGYSNQLNEAVTFSTGLEYLQGLSDTAVRRFNADAKLSSKIGEGFSVATSFSLRFDNSPLPGKEETDTVTALNLVYTLL